MKIKASSTRGGFVPPNRYEWEKPAWTMKLGSARKGEAIKTGRLWKTIGGV
jgi:hypothetical protein